MQTSEQLSRLIEDPTVEGSVYSAPFNIWMRAVVDRDIAAIRETSSSGQSFEIPLSQAQVDFLHKGVAYMTAPLRYSRDEVQKRKIRRMALSLQGILGVAAKTTKTGNEYHVGYFLPEENRDALNWANISGAVIMSSDGTHITGPFVKALEAEDVPVLRAISNRDLELREKFKGHLIPSFHTTEVAKLAGVDYQDAVQSIHRLSGLIGQKRIHTKPYFPRDKWFVPTARRVDIDNFLAQNPQ